MDEFQTTLIEVLREIRDHLENIDFEMERMNNYNERTSDSLEKTVRKLDHITDHLEKIAYS